MPATPQSASKMIGGPETAATELSQTAQGPLGTPKSSPWRAPETPRSPFPAALGTPRGSPEPPRREYANGSRGSTNSGRPARAPCTPGHTQPPALHRLCSDASSWTFSPVRSLRPPLAPDPRGRRIDWAAPTAADPERGSCGQQYENGPLRFLLRVLRRRVQPAANDVEPR